MSDEKVITPFELGVCSALMLIGKALALNPNVDIDQLKKDAQAIMDTLPDEPKWHGGTERVHHGAIESLLRGVERVQR